MLRLIKNISKHKYLILAVAYTIWLTTLSLIPLNNVPLPDVKFGDKVVHFFLYFFLTIIWLFACPKLRTLKYKFLFIVILWGILIEFLQEYMVYLRTGDVYDALANAVGALLGYILASYYLMRNQS